MDVVPTRNSPHRRTHYAVCIQTPLVAPRVFATHALCAAHPTPHPPPPFSDQSWSHHTGRRLRALSGRPHPPGTRGGRVWARRASVLRTAALQRGRAAPQRDVRSFCFFSRPLRKDAGAHQAQKQRVCCAAVCDAQRTLCGGERRRGTGPAAHTDGYPHPPPPSYDAADADPGDPDETKFSDDEEEAAHLQREQMEAKARAQATASQVRVFGVRRGGACACWCASHCVPG